MLSLSITSGRLLFSLQLFSFIPPNDFHSMVGWSYVSLVSITNSYTVISLSFPSAFWQHCSSQSSIMLCTCFLIQITGTIIPGLQVIWRLKQAKTQSKKSFEQQTAQSRSLVNTDINICHHFIICIIVADSVSAVTSVWYRNNILIRDGQQHLTP